MPASVFIGIPEVQNELATVTQINSHIAQIARQR